MVTPDGRYLRVGNYLDRDFSILQVDGKKITDTGKRFKGARPPGLGADERGLTGRLVRPLPATPRKKGGLAAALRAT